MSKHEKQCIVDLYVMILHDYFTKFTDCEICNYESIENVPADDQLTNHLFTGITIINRVFEYTFLKTKNISTTHYYTSDAIVYYLEYMVQIYRANLFHSTSSTDAVFFVYKKTIFDLFDSTNAPTTAQTSSVELGGRSILSNIIRLNRDSCIMDHVCPEDFNGLLLTVHKLVNVLLRGGTYRERIECCRRYADPFLKNIDRTGGMIAKLALLHEHFNIPDALLRELAADIEKTRKPRSNSMTENDITLAFHQQKSVIGEHLDRGDIGAVAAWCLRGT
jgi:hypothetical protein